MFLSTLEKTGHPFPAGAVKAGQTTSVLRAGQPGFLNTGQPSAPEPRLKTGQADDDDDAASLALKGHPDAALAWALKGHPPDDDAPA